jgi:hypothetical protein
MKEASMTAATTNGRRTVGPAEVVEVRLMTGKSVAGCGWNCLRPNEALRPNPQRNRLHWGDQILV